MFLKIINWLTQRILGKEQNPLDIAFKIEEPEPELEEVINEAPVVEIPTIEPIKPIVKEEKVNIIEPVVDNKLFDRTYSREDIKRIQRALNELTSKINRTPLVADGVFGAKSISLLNELQKLRGYPVSNSFTGDIQRLVMNYVSDKYITEEDKINRAREIGMEPAMLFAIMEVEAKDAGFLDDGRCTILFERHQFFKHYSAIHGRGAALNLSKQYPNICSSTPGGYRGGKAEHDRLNQAIELDRTSALASASYGLGQVMGFNWKLVGAKSLEDFYTRSIKSEKEQLLFMTNFLVNANSGAILRAANGRDFASVARYYNGPGYAKNKYDIRIRDAYNKYIKIYKR